MWKCPQLVQNANIEQAKQGGLIAFIAKDSAFVSIHSRPNATSGVFDFADFKGVIKLRGVGKFHKFHTLNALRRAVAQERRLWRWMG